MISKYGRIKIGQHEAGLGDLSCSTIKKGNADLETQVRVKADQ
jgi:hypothetical protein